MAGFYFEYWVNGYWNTVLPLPDGGYIYETATSMALSAVVFSQVYFAKFKLTSKIGNLFATRTEVVSFFETPIFANKLMWFGILFELGLLFGVLNIPFLQEMFGTRQYSYWGNFVFLIMCVPMLLFSEEIRKLISRRCWKVRKF